MGLCRNCKVRSKLKKTSGPLVTEEITTASDYCGKASSERRGNMSTVPKLVSNDHAGVVNCEGRMK